jgi:hypothetical protein
MFPVGRFELLAVALVALSAFSLAWLFGRFTKSSRRRAVAFSAAPIPVVGLLLSIWVIVDAAISSAEECGVDACGMAIAAAFTVIILSVLAFLLAALFARMGFWIARR